MSEADELHFSKPFTHQKNSVIYRGTMLNWPLDTENLVRDNWCRCVLKKTLSPKRIFEKFRGNPGFYIFIKNWYFQITYHELESFNGEQQLGRSEFVSDPIFPLSNLLPGRNYSISVQAVSKGVESVERSIFQVWPLKKFSLSVKNNPLA